MFRKKLLLSFFMLLFVLTSSLIVLGESNSGYLSATLLNQDPDPAVSGDYVELRWKVEKVGLGLFKDVEFELIPSYPLTFDKSDSSIKSLGSLSGFLKDEEQYILYYKLFVDSSAKKDEYPVKLKISYTQNGVSSSQISSFDIFVDEKESSSFVVGKVSSSPIELYSDSSDNKFSVDIENIGDALAKEVVAHLVLPDGFSPSYGYSTRSVLGSIPSGSGKSALFYVDLDESIPSGVYNASLTLQYADDSDDDNTYRQLSIPFDIPVHAKPQFELVSVELMPKVAHPGSNVKAYFTVKNIGEKEALGVSLRAFKESSQPFDFSDNSDFIGTLNPGALGKAILEFSVDSDANVKDYLLDLEIRGVYQEEVFVDDATASISVTAGKDSSSSNLVFPILMLVVGLVLGYFISKSSKSKKK